MYKFYIHILYRICMKYTCIYVYIHIYMHICIYIYEYVDILLIFLMKYIL